MAGVRIGAAWDAVWEAGVWETGVWEPTPTTFDDAAFSTDAFSADAFDLTPAAEIPPAPSAGGYRLRRKPSGGQ